MTVWLYILKLLSLIIGIILRPLAYLVPKKRNLILFIGGGDGQFRDNIKYLYIQMVRSRQERFEFYFLTEDKKLFSQLQKHDLPVLVYPRLSNIRARAELCKYLPKNNILDF